MREGILRSIGSKLRLRKPSAPCRDEYANYARGVSDELMRCARRICPNDEDTRQDLVQNAIVTGYRCYMEGTLQLQVGSKKWFATTMARDYLMRVRKDRRLVAMQDSVIESFSRSTSHLPGERLFAESLSERLEAALATLPSSQRVVVVLVDLEQATYKEAAVSLSVPVGTVRSRLARARLALAQILEESPGEREK